MPCQHEQRTRTAGIAAAVAATVLLAVGSFALVNNGVLLRDFVAGTGASGELHTAVISSPRSYSEIFETLEERFKNASLISAASGDNVGTVVTASASAPPDIGGVAPEASINGSTVSFSQTNVQVAGVDEADIVKTDGTYIYTVFDNKVCIFAANGSYTKEISSISISYGTAGELYVWGDRLVVMIHSKKFSSNLFWTAYMSTSNFAAVYDISEPENPVLINTFGQDGRLVSSRMIDGTLYMISSYRVEGEHIKRSEPQTFVPNLYDGAIISLNDLEGMAQPLASESIFIVPEYSNTQYTVVTAIDINRAERTSELAFLGNSNTMYQNHDYLFLPVRIEPTPKSLPETCILQVALHDGSLSLAASAIVSGTPLNQFSLDVYDGFLRVVMTEAKTVTSSGSSFSGESAGNVTTFNKLLIFDSDLRIVGSVEDLAPGELIYSARFAGEVGYMVTFRRIDPLFSLDLSNPFNPRVMDELKISGFSTYLHPYAEGQLLGIGVDADEGWIFFDFEFAPKLTMFDVSNPFDISEAHTLQLEAKDAPILWNHKAVLIDAEKNIIGFEIEGRFGEFTLDTFPGSSFTFEPDNLFVIYGYDNDEGFYERATVPLLSRDDKSRALYIGEYLYISHGNFVFAYELETFKDVTFDYLKV